MFGASTDVLHAKVGPTWPLVQRLMADEVYAARYRVLLGQALGGLFEPAAFERRARELHALIAPSVVGGRGERPTHRTISSPAAFNRALDSPDGLLTRTRTRHDVVRKASNDR